MHKLSRTLHKKETDTERISFISFIPHTQFKKIKIRREVGSLGRNSQQIWSKPTTNGLIKALQDPPTLIPQTKIQKENMKTFVELTSVPVLAQKLCHNMSFTRKHPIF